MRLATEVGYLSQKPQAAWRRALCPCRWQLPPFILANILMPAQELNWRLCANRSDVVPTLLAAFAKPGSEEANTAVAATQLACADGYGIELLYLMAASPPDDNSDGSLLARLAHISVAHLL